MSEPSGHRGIELSGHKCPDSLKRSEPVGKIRSERETGEGEGLRDHVRFTILVRLWLSLKVRLKVSKSLEQNMKGLIF